ncbi:MAG: hypothetical protein O7E49_09485 [Gemmatimonadetes bacterium]|nr:hypothetical protein [Gemmatimonadota bacterium]
MSGSLRLCVYCLLLTSWLGWGTVTASGQEVDSTPPPITSTEVLSGKAALTLPLDSVAQGLVLLPGIELSDAGLLVIRGGQVHGQAVYLDGVPVSPGQRSSGFLFGLGTSLRKVALDPALRLGTNALSIATVTTGAYEATYGNAGSGIIAVSTRAPTGPITGAFRYDTDELAGVTHGTGTNRILADIGGSITNRLRFYVAGVIDGHQSADNGPGTNDIPMFIPGASDTTVVFGSTPGDPQSDTSRVSIYQFPIGRGRCDSFAGSLDPGIAGNYGTDCSRLPASARSGYQFLGSLGFDPVPHASLVFSAVATQDQTRLFDYSNLTNGQQLEAQRTTSSALTLTYRHHLGAPDLGWDLFGALSYQRDQAEVGPLTASGEADTRYPTGGFMITPLDFLFGFENFPVNDRLVENFRDNIPGSRRNPYDIENTDQYRATLEYRTNPYGLAGAFSESGGPTGSVGLFKETRKVATVSATWRPNRHHNVTLGGEYTAYSVTNYFHQLTSQAGADLYVQHPNRSAVFLQDRIVTGNFTVVGGLRLDAFSSGAQRPFLLDLESSSPTFNEYVFFPRTSSYQGTAVIGEGPADCSATGCPLTKFIEDPSHTAFTPHVQLGYAVAPRTSLWASAGQQAQIPDFYRLYTGVNTDVSITSTSQVFSVDQGFNQVNIADLGIRHRFSPKLALAASVYYKDHTAESQPRLENLQDPARGTDSFIGLYRSDGGRSVKGFDVKADINLGRVFDGWVGYSYANAERADGLTPSATRPHSLTGALSLALPDDWRAGTTLGAVGRNVGVYTIFRFASGEPYTRCPAAVGNEGVLSGELCVRQFEASPNSFRLPTVKRLDLRLAKGFSIRSTFVNVFLDVRNLFNFTNTHTVYAVTGTTESSGLLNLVKQNNLSSWEREAVANGARLSNGNIVLPPGAGACNDWVAQSGQGASPSCVYLIRAEQRYGNGDGIFDREEQELAIEAFYAVLRGSSNFTDPPRRIRLGLEWRF